MELPTKLKEWLKLPGARLLPREIEFIARMRESAATGVGYGFMQQVIEWEWQDRAIGSHGPEYFRKRIDELEKERDALRASITPPPSAPAATPPHEPSPATCRDSPEAEADNLPAE